MILVRCVALPDGINSLGVFAVILVYALAVLVDSDVICNRSWGIHNSGSDCAQKEIFPGLRISCYSLQIQFIAIDIMFPERFREVLCRLLGSL